METVPMQVYAKIKKHYPGCIRYRPEDDARLTDLAGWYLTGTQAMELSCASLKAPVMAACWAWGRTKRVYAFDSDLARSLTAQADTLKENDILPLKVLSRLPCSSFYVQAPDLICEGISGFFVWFEKEAQEKILRLLFVLPEKSFSFRGICIYTILRLWKPVCPARNSLPIPAFWRHPRAIRRR